MSGRSFRLVAVGHGRHERREVDQRCRVRRCGGRTGCLAGDDAELRLWRFGVAGEEAPSASARAGAERDPGAAADRTSSEISAIVALDEHGQVIYTEPVQ